MDKNILYFLLFISILFIGAGTYLTIIAREDPDKNTVPDWVTSHLNTIKIIGPILIGIGIISMGLASYNLMNSNTVDTTKSNFGYGGCGGDTTSKLGYGGKTKSNFGFKFY